jgi:3-hydroxyacyl-[acyl-carrier-protein] dehydratase
MSLDEIQAAIPHRQPFLFVDQVVAREPARIVCRRTFHPDEPFFAGHYPNFPLVPGVVLCEAAMQAGAVLLSAQVDLQQGIPVAARLKDVRFRRMVRPGETIEMEVRLVDRLQDAFFLEAKVTCQGELALRMDFTCCLTAPPQ